MRWNVVRWQKSPFAIFIHGSNALDFRRSSCSKVSKTFGLIVRTRDKLYILIILIGSAEGVNPIAARAYVLETICAIIRVAGPRVVFEASDMSNDRVNIATQRCTTVASIKPMEDFEPSSANCWRQAMRLWSLCANRNVPTCPTADDYFSLLANCVDVDPSNVSNEGAKRSRGV